MSKIRNILARKISFLTVARGPVPRDRSTAAENARNPETTDVLLRPTHGEGQARALRAMRRLPIAYRSAGACPPRSANLCEKRQHPKDHGCFAQTGAWRGTGPRPTCHAAIDYFLP